ncbi:MAG: hypothetical protein KatS3mg109_0120 [Pirellulaceae bacterium]|nr:MAG: hypothetical protein KatS3mg109_0120 [Pirellulaceae bacterium]
MRKEIQWLLDASREQEKFETLQKPFMNWAVRSVIAAGGRPILVGGCVRDLLLGRQSKDLDFEVYGLSAQQLLAALNDYRPSVVGKSFGVIKAVDPIAGEIDFSLPREESKTGKGHRGFMVTVDPDLPFEVAASRRDFTINAMGLDAHDNVLDPFGGQDDLAKGIIRHVGLKFAEDPLRILRACRFASQLGFVIHHETVDVCKELAPALKELPGERVFAELEKLLLGKDPMLGVNYLQDTGAMSVILPEVAALESFQQDPVWHPEGDAFAHTKFVVHAARQVCERRGFDREKTIAVMFGSLLHDVGKIQCTTIKDGCIKSPDHERVSGDMVPPIMERLKAPTKLTRQVQGLAALHMAFDRNEKPTVSAVRRLAQKLADFDLDVPMWAALIEADHSGRPPKPPHNPVQKYEEIYAADEARAKPILMGRHLVDLGLEPGPEFRPILDKVFELQLEGRVSTLDEAIAEAKRLIPE